MTIRPLLARAARGFPSATAPRTQAPVGFPLGKALISAIAGVPPLGAFAADWNETHIYNPNWPPHAKFHNAQTMVSAVLLPALSLWQLWGRRPAEQRSALRLGALLAATYYLTQAPAILFPGAAVVDPEFEDTLPTLFGVKLNVLYGQVLLYPVLALGYALESRRLRRAGR